MAHWYSVCGTDWLDEDTMAKTPDCISVQFTFNNMLSKIRNFEVGERAPLFLDI